MAQVLEEQKKNWKARDIFVAISDVRSRSILEILRREKHLTYSALLRIWQEYNKSKSRYNSGLFAFHLRKLKAHNLIMNENSTRQYLLSFKGKQIFKAIDIINKIEKIEIKTYPACLRIRMSDSFSDEELLNEAVTRIITEIKKIK